MTLLTINIEKIGLKDAGQCIDPYITVSVKGNDFCSWLLISSLERVHFLKAVLIFFSLLRKIFVGTCIFCCGLKAAALMKGGKKSVFERYWEVNHCRRHASLRSGVPSPCWELSISDLADCTSLFQLLQLTLKYRSLWTACTPQHILVSGLSGNSEPQSAGSILALSLN